MPLFVLFRSNFLYIAFIMYKYLSNTQKSVLRMFKGFDLPPTPKPCIRRSQLLWPALNGVG